MNNFPISDEEIQELQRRQALGLPAPSTSPVPTTESTQIDFKQLLKDRLAERINAKPHEERQKLLEQVQEGPGIASIIGGAIGAFAGDRGETTRKILEGDRKFRTDALSQFDKAQELKDTNLMNMLKADELSQGLDIKARERDPSSEFSKVAQGLAGKMLPAQKALFNTMSAEEINKLIPSLTSVYEKEQDRALKRELANQEAMLKAMSIDTKAQLTPGQKAVDSKFAAEYVNWSGGGRDSALIEIDKLKGARERLTELSSVGPIAGRLPDVFSTERTAVRADVESTIMNSLRAILGAAFTEKEGQRVINATWNEKDTVENNAARLDRLVATLDSQAKAKDAMTQYYEANGTLQGFKGAEAATDPKKLTDSLVNQQKTATEIVEVMDPSGKVRRVPASAVARALESGGKLVQPKRYIEGRIKSQEQIAPGVKKVTYQDGSVEVVRE